MRILLLNKFTSPDPAPTARLLGELGTGLQERGWEVASRSAGGSYRQGTGSGGLKRWIREAWAHVRLFVAGCLAPRPDVILCLSDPPGLVFTASLVSRIRRIPLAHWVMDVYPQIASALGEVSPQSLPYQFLKKAVHFGIRRCSVIGCLDEDMAWALEIQDDPRLHLCSPWPPLTLPCTGSGEAPSVREPSRPFLWLYSGNLGRAHEFDTLLQAQKNLENERLNVDLVFQGRGPQLQIAKERATHLALQRCRWLDYVSDQDLVSSLRSADVLVATQKPETKGLLWPSKLALLKHIDRPILWVGPLDGRIAQMLQKEFPESGVFAPGDIQGVTNWLRGRISDPNSSAGVIASSSWREILAHTHSIAVDDWHQRLLQLAGPPRSSS